MLALNLRSYKETRFSLDLKNLGMKVSIGLEVFVIRSYSPCSPRGDLGKKVKKFLLYGVA